MSGGMDIDWNVHDFLLIRAKKKFGSSSREELDNKSEEINQKIQSLEADKNKIDILLINLREDIDDMWLIYKDRKYL